MRFFFDQYYQVAGAAAALTGIAAPADAELHAFLHTGRDVDIHGFLAIHPSFALTMAAFYRDGTAFAVAGGAGCYGLHLAQEGAGYLAYLSAAAACAAVLDRALVFCTAAAAGIAGHVFFYL